MTDEKDLILANEKKDLKPVAKEKADLETKRPQETGRKRRRQRQKTWESIDPETTTSGKKHDLKNGLEKRHT